MNGVIDFALNPSLSKNDEATLEPFPIAFAFAELCWREYCDQLLKNDD